MRVGSSVGMVVPRRDAGSPRHCGFSVGGGLATAATRRLRPRPTSRASLPCNGRIAAPVRHGPKIHQPALRTDRHLRRRPVRHPHLPALPHRRHDASNARRRRSVLEPWRRRRDGDSVHLHPLLPRHRGGPGLALASPAGNMTSVTPRSPLPLPALVLAGAATAIAQHDTAQDPTKQPMYVAPASSEAQDRSAASSCRRTCCATWSPPNRTCATRSRSRSMARAVATSPRRSASTTACPTPGATCSGRTRTSPA